VGALQAALGSALPVRVFCDGTDDELRPLLGLDAVERVERAATITDKLALSQSSALIASGSTFSMWGCYLVIPARRSTAEKSTMMRGFQACLAATTPKLWRTARRCDH